MINFMINRKFRLDYLIGLFALLIIFFVINFYSNYLQSNDMNLYQGIANKTIGGFVPYQGDFFFEYPPMVAYFFVLINFVKNVFFLSNFQTAFALVALLMTYTLLFLSKDIIKEKKTEVLILTAFSFFVSSNVLFERYDIIPTFLTFISLYIIIKSYKNNYLYLLAGLLIASGIFTKLFPIFVVLPVLVYFITNKLFTKMYYYIIGIVIITLPNLFLVLQGLEKAKIFYNYHSLRGLEITSFGATLARILSFFGIGNLSRKTLCCPYGSVDLDYSYTGAIKTFLNLMLVSGLLILIFSLYRHFKNKNFISYDLITYTTLFFSLFIITNKVFSTQYIIWIIPFVFLSFYSIKDRITKYILVLLSLYVIVINNVVLLFMWGDMNRLDLLPVVLTDTKNIAFWIVFLVLVWEKSNMNRSNKILHP